MTSESRRTQHGHLEGALVHAGAVAEKQVVTSTVRPLGVHRVDDCVVADRCDSRTSICLQVPAADGPCHFWRWFTDKVNVQMQYLAGLDRDIFQRSSYLWSHCNKLILVNKMEGI